MAGKTKSPSKLIDPGLLCGPHRVKTLDRSTDARFTEFVQNYLTNNFNAKQAAIDTGYSIDTAGKQAADLLHHPEVQKKLDTAFKERRDKYEITTDRVLQELGCIAFLDIADVLTDSGDIRKLSDMPEHARRALAGIDIQAVAGMDNADAVIYLKKLKTCGKEKALELLGKHLKLFTEKVEHSVGGDLADAIKAARKRVPINVTPHGEPVQIEQSEPEREQDIEEPDFLS